MVTGTPRAPYPRALTKRLPAAHSELNAVRKTLHHSPHTAGNPPRIPPLIPAAHDHVQTAHRALVRALVLVAAFVALLAVASPAAAAKSCGRAVIDDWYDDGRVDGTYALHCYDDAIEILPRDVRDYSSAKDDIQRALTNARRGEPAPPATTDPTPGGGTTTPEDPDDPTETDSTGTPAEGSGDPPTGNEAGGAIDADSDSASSVPIPLLILAGLALLLVIGGSAGYVIRRLQARRLPPTAT